MSDQQRRRPASFSVDPVEPPLEAVRRPSAFDLREGDVAPDEIDVFALSEQKEATLPVAPRRRRSKLAGLFFGALGVLLSLAFGLWTDALLRDLFSRAEWLGWLGAAAAALTVLALAAILLREGLALRRLASVEAMRERGRQVLLSNDASAARSLVGDLESLLASRPETASGRRILGELRDDVIDGDSLLRLAETELLGPIDARARAMVLESAKRVSLVTAVSPRAIYDVAFVVFEGGRLVRRLAELYGGRPGTLGFVRLARSALAHLAVTGSIAAGDSVIQQLVGHGLAARLSAKLGEGVINGTMTARIGIAAMEAARPLPFAAVPRPGLGDFVSALARVAARPRPER
ncbi:MAG: TIGR01620 family protein [Methylobacterium mesophilicum]|nr:TIGR01620 family protein [Methylobacterium mesophilicum]